MSSIVNPRFGGRIAVVTGAASGIGRGVAVRLAAEGAVVALFDVNADGMRDTAAEISASNGESRPYRVDVSNRDNVNEAVAAVADELGVPSVAVNCAGISQRSPALELTCEQWDRMIGINLTGTFAVCQACAKLMGQGGAIVNISSVAAEVASGESAHYAAAKGGIRQLTKALAVSLAPQDIRVNAVGPGPIESEMSRARIAKDGGSASLLGRVLRGRMGRPSDIAAAVAFLASDEADFITGTTLYVDGGILAVR